MDRDALICRKGPHGWRWCVVPMALVPDFQAHGWVIVLTSDEMLDADIEAARKTEEAKRLNKPRWQQPWCNGD